ncbi:protein of unknown function DUF305 [Segniliparus rotundus DSM 44985]|uniref:DUF305 domain-containing protein n=1 Tax=Segniliparus rotundus (strain ATCC BAA-972 / CDC 1076 / CIP 108378 / DSM 44985 / JCM 13578) TaxID=640132 RepID=D6ZBM6_SEGRD|nr:DUF305 domain-containing protein [Segniliparus rotundus]ADG98978.1 protein of unknown function DUF305 [Segniliparus rotundus DSM 44985]
MRNVHSPFGFAALAALALSSTACSGSQPASQPSTAQAAQHNQSDVDFVAAMAQHHQQALDLAELVPDRSQNDEVKALAARIRDEQAPEIDQFRALEKEFGASTPASTPMPDASPGAMAGMDMGGAAGMVPENDVEQLRNLSGLKFDTRWIGLMAEHHDGAVKMAQNEIAKGQSPEAKRIAQNIVAAQTAEVAELGALLQQISAEK